MTKRLRPLARVHFTIEKHPILIIVGFALLWSIPFIKAAVLQRPVPEMFYSKFAGVLGISIITGLAISGTLAFDNADGKSLGFRLLLLTCGIAGIALFVKYLLTGIPKAIWGV